MHAHPSRTLPSLSTLALASMLAACGGGSGTPEPVQPQAVRITGKAVDGALQGAVACYDLDDNSRCDAGEPVSAPSDAQGGFTLEVAADQAGRHRVVVQVGEAAVDADTGRPVGLAFQLLAPPSGQAGEHAVFASPLSTLVLGEVDRRGVSLAQAEAQVGQQAGLALSPLADFTAAADEAHRHAARVARGVLVSLQSQQAALAGLVGKVDLSGQPVEGAALDALAHDLTIAALPRLGAAMADPGMADAQGQALRGAVDAAAARVAQALTPPEAEALATLGAARLPAAPEAAAAQPTLLVPVLRYTDADNWFMRSFEQTAAEAMPAADGSRIFRSVYRQRVAGVDQTWSHGRSLERSGDRHWDGTAWVNCQESGPNTTVATGVPGQSRYDYCQGLETGLSTSTVIDVSGQVIADVVRARIRSFPGSYAGVAYADWGPADLGQLGAVVFPAGAELRMTTTTTMSTAMAYDVLPTARLKVASAAVAAGGDARGGGSPACSASDPGAYATSLEQVVERYPGQPCVFDPGSNSDGDTGPRNESWGWTSLGMGTLSGVAQPPEGTGAYYSDQLRIRISFDGGGSDAVTFWQCLVRRDGGSTRQCDAIGRGRYTIQALGDARVLRVAPLPERVRELGHEQVYVERDGFVHYGWISGLVVGKTSLRLNMQAANAVLSALGLAPINP